MRRLAIALACAGVALFAPSGAPVLPPAAAAEAPGTLRGPIAQLGWLIGDWDCTVKPSKTDAGQPLQVIRRRITTSPDGLVLLQVQHGTGLATRGMIGYDAKKKSWFEVDETQSGDLDRQGVIGPASALRSNSLTLVGYVPAPDGRRFPLRTIYAWKDHSGFTFSAQLFRKDKHWQTFQSQSCVRASPAGTIPGAT